MALYSDLNRRDAKDRSRVVDFEAVFNSVENNIRQPARQRLFRPDGLDPEALLFELDDATAYRVKNLIFKAVTKDPRAKMLYDQSYVLADPDNHVFQVVIRFQIVGLDDQTYTKTGTIRGPSE